VTFPISIRSATPGDADAILRCLASAFEPYRESYTKEAYLDTVLTSETIEKRFASMSILVAVTGSGDIVGTISLQANAADEGHLRGMAVPPACMGAGVAERLLRAAEGALAARGCTRISLDTTEPLLRAIRFYEKHGYRRSGTVSQFFGMPLVEYVRILSA
jgi:ribosomal protein S18 acetylase RimI-like enzyme